MKRAIWLMAVVCGVAAGVKTSVAGDVRSVNTHAMIKVDAPSTNVLIAVPWNYYTPDSSTTTNLPVDHLVWPRNLDDGDLLMMVTADSQQTADQYDSWMLVRDVKNSDAAAHWESTFTAAKGGDTQSDNRRPVPRGIGLWLLRQNPQNANGSWKPVYLYGQRAAGAATVSISNETAAANAVMVANPNCSTLAINTDITWTGVHTNDTLSLPNGTDAWDLCLWDATSNKWYCSKSVRVGRKVTTSKNYDLSIPAGRGFWYIRRAAGEIKINFTDK